MYYRKMNDCHEESYANWHQSSQSQDNYENNNSCYPDNFCFDDNGYENGFNSECLKCKTICWNTENGRRGNDCYEKPVNNYQKHCHNHCSHEQENQNKCNKHSFGKTCPFCNFFGFWRCK